MQDYTEVLDLIYKKSLFQKKKIEKDFSKRDKVFFDEFNLFLTEYTAWLNSQNIDIDYAVDAYIELCADMLDCQKKFLKSGEYPTKSSEMSFEQTYSNLSKMKSYMAGLALSQFLWKTHYEIYKFYDKFIAGKAESVYSYLEIGPGHGLFLKAAITHLSNVNSFTVVDISPQSIEITKSLIEFFFKETQKVTYNNCDIMDFHNSKTYELITMGEVLEHVANPGALLKKIRNILSPNGKIFISTCVNCPAIDHIYHFKTVDEIRDMLSSNGLMIVNERVLPVEDFPMERIVKNNITINYCAVLSKDGSSR
ncbi:MAG: class I SAM-dependent methyltransferase [Nitrospirae bacterium YQR-1]